MPGTSTRIQREIVRLCHSGLDSRTLRSAVVEKLSKAIQVDAAFFAAVDPGTMLFTGTVQDELLSRNTAGFLRNEFLQDDVNKFTSLARESDHVSWLAEATDGRLQNSQRFREILEPLELGDELRVALVSRKACWGVMCLHKELGSANFSPEEAAFITEVAPHLAEGLRTALLIGAGAQEGLPQEPGLILLRDNLSIAAATPAADVWLRHLLGRTVAENNLPQVVSAVAAKLLAIEQGADVIGLPRARLRTESGKWIVIHASRLSTEGDRGPIAILLEEAQPLEIASQIIQAYGLSSRESEVAQLVLRGFPTSEISGQLFISSNTVQDHLKSIFEKVGVSSRREFVAGVFAGQYLPKLQANAEIGANGWFK